MDLIQVKIKPDNNTLKYISMIRKFDKSLSIGEIKDNIEAGEVIGASLSFYHNDELEEKQYIVNWIDTVEEIRQQTEYGHGLERD